MVKAFGEIKVFPLSRRVNMHRIPEPPRLVDDKRRQYTIGSVAELRSWYAPAHAAAVRKERRYLDEHACRMIQLSSYLVIASSHRVTGSHDCSPRGGAPGFIRISNESQPKTLMIPDMPGNNRLDSLENIASYGGSHVEPEGAPVGLLVLVPGLNETLRINGHAILSTDPLDLEACMPSTEPLPGGLPKLVIKVRVDSVYVHGGGSTQRARLWDADAQQDPSLHPGMQEMITPTSN